MDDFENSENISNEIMSSMKLKDEIIGDLYNKLEFEMNENNVLRNKLKESNFDNDLSDDENKEHRIKISVETNHQSKDNEKKKLLDEIKNLNDKINDLEKNNSKNQNLNEIEVIFRKQIESLTQKLEISEKKAKDISHLFEEKDKYINDLLKHIKKIEKDHESSIASKNMEINNLNSKLSFTNENVTRLSNQINSMTKNTNSITQELMQELKQFEEKNKQLEIKIFQQEKIIIEKEKQSEIKVSLLPLDNTISQSSLDPLNKSKMETQSKVISNMKIELMNLNFNNEKLTNELFEEKELNQRLQKSLAELKYKFNNNTKNDICVEELSVQTILKSENIDQINKKNKSQEIEINKLNETLQQNEKTIRKLNDKQHLMEKENKKICEELNTLILKYNKEKKQSFNHNFDHEIINNVLIISKLNATVSSLKSRENEYIERIQMLESSNIEKETNTSNDNKLVIHSRNYLNPKKNNINSNEENTVVSFNVSDQSILDPVKSFINTSLIKKNNKDVIKNETEFNKLLEDNINLKDTMFKYICEIENLKNIINEFRENYIKIDQEKNQILDEKNEYINHMDELRNELQKKDNRNILTNDEFNKKLFELTETNNKINEQLLSLQNKFQVQNQLNQEKNIKIQEITKELEKISTEKTNYFEKSNKFNERVILLEKENVSLKKDKETFKNERDNMSMHIQETSKKTISIQKENEEKINLLSIENEKLKELNHKYKVKLKELFEEIKLKDNKLEEKELDNQLKLQLQETRIENEKLMKERSQLRINLNEVLIENKTLKEKVNAYSNQNCNSRLNTSLDNSMNNSMIHNSKSKNIQKNNLNKIALEKEVSLLREENIKFIRDFEELKNKLGENENIRRSLSIEVQAFEIEKKRFQDIIMKNEQELRNLKNDIKNLKNNNDNLNDFQNLLNEINEKNQTINFLIEECDNVKKENTKKYEGLKSNLDSKEDEISKIKEILENSKREYDNYKISSLNNNNGLKKENEILINDLEIKEKDVEKLLNENEELKNHVLNNNKEFNSVAKSLQENLEIISDENDKIKNEIKKLIEDHIENNQKITLKIKKNDQKVDKIFQVYENHINFIKIRFQNELNDILSSYNSGKGQNREFLDKFIKNLENYTALVNDNASKDAKIEIYKSDIKLLNKLNNTQLNNIKLLTKENEELKESLINNKSWQNKNTSQTTIKEKCNLILDYNHIQKLKEYEIFYNNNSSYLLEEQKYKLKTKNKDTEINLLKEHIEKLKNDKANLEENIMVRERDFKALQTQYNEMIKNFKSELLKNTNELSRIKEKWLPPEKAEELMNQLSNYEKTLKTLKEDITRKKELINHLKSTGNKESKKSEEVNDLSSITEKLKNITKESNRKDIYVKELKSNMEVMKNTEKKNIEEINALNEKVKLLKIELNRKDEMIKSSKDKIQNESSINEATDKYLEQVSRIKEKNKKLKSDFEKKDALIKTYKNKIDSLILEVDQSKTQINMLNKNKCQDVEVNQKLNDKLKCKYEQLNKYNDSLVLIMKRIFKDLVTHSDNLTQINSNRNNSLTKYKDGLDILNISPNELDEFVNPSNQNTNFDYYCKLVENMNNIDPALIFENYLNLKEKILKYYQKITELTESQKD